MRELYQVAVANGLHPRVTSVFRSRTTQTRLYRNFLAGRSRWPAAPPGHSKHERGLAFDMLADNLPALGALWERWGGRWGGRFHDEIHFEI